MNDRILSLLSLATKAGKTVGGEMLVEKAVKEGKASLVIISSEASGNTRKEELGHFTGKKFRASVAVLGHEFYDSFVKLFTDMEVTE